MNTHLDSEHLVSSYDRLPRERQAQVLEYARWLRENDVELPERLRSRPPPTILVELDAELKRALRKLCGDKQLLIEEYVIALAAGRGVPGHALLRFIGTIPEETLQRMEQIIEEECERIDYDGW